MNDKPIVCVDLDGVLNLFDGWKEASYFHPPRPGAADFLASLHGMGYHVVIHTVRWAPHVWEWLREHKLDGYVQEVTDRKLPAHVYIDDRAICFSGDFHNTLSLVSAFKAHWESQT